jgi:hypothetical protein
MDGRIAGGDRDSKPINWVTRDNRDYRAWVAVYIVFTVVCVVARLRLVLDRIRRAVVPGMSGLIRAALDARGPPPLPHTKPGIAGFFAALTGIRAALRRQPQPVAEDCQTPSVRTPVLFLHPTRIIRRQRPFRAASSGPSERLSKGPRDLMT